MTSDWREQVIFCAKCHKYLFTEYEKIGTLISLGNYKRENDKGNYEYDEITDEFICNDCRRENKNE